MWCHRQLSHRIAIMRCCALSFIYIYVGLVSPPAAPEKKVEEKKPEEKKTVATDKSQSKAIGRTKITLGARMSAPLV